MKFLFIKDTVKLLLFICLNIPNFAQTISVSGNISIGDSIGVKNALITFIDESNINTRWVTKSDSFGNYHLEIITSITDDSRLLPKAIELEQNYPNPFSEETTISYKLNKSKNIKLEIFDILGQKVKSLHVGTQSIGKYNLYWDGRDSFGKLVSKGIYFYQLHTEKESIVKKMLFINGKLYSGFKVESNFLNQSINDQTIPSSKTYTIEVRNSNNTSPWIERYESKGVSIEQSNILDIEAEKELTEKYYLYIGDLYYNIIVYDVETHTLIDTISNFEYEVWDIEITNNNKKLYVCTKKGPLNAPGYVYSINLDTKESETFLSKSAEIFKAPNGVPFIVAEEPYDSLRHLGVIDTITNQITWIDTLSIYPIGFSNQGLVFARNDSILYCLNNDYKLFKYNYITNQIIRNYNSINYYYDHFVFDPNGEFIYCAGGPAINTKSDSIVGSFSYASYDFNGSIALSSDGTFLCSTDPAAYAQLNPEPTGKIAVFEKLPDGFYSNDNYFIDVRSATPYGTGYYTDKIYLTNNNRMAFVSNWINCFYVINIKKRIVSDIIQVNELMGPSLLVPK